MEKTLDFKVIFYMLRAKLVWIVVSAIVGALVAYSISTFVLAEEYTSKTQVYISNKQEVQEDKINSSDLSASRSMANTYCIILQSPRAVECLRENLMQNPQYTSSSVRSYKISFSVQGNTEVLNISVTSPDPNIAALVCNTMVDVSEELISEIFEGGRSNSLGEAMPNYVPSSPNTRMNMLLGILVGVAISGALSILWFMLDNRVKDESDFVQKVGIPVLGEIPSIHEDAPRKRSTKKKKGYGYYYAYTKKSND